MILSKRNKIEIIYEFEDKILFIILKKNDIIDYEKNMCLFLYILRILRFYLVVILICCLL